MKLLYSQLKRLLPELDWPTSELAAKLSLIGFEADSINDQLNITLTANRRDCQDVRYLAFDLAGVYDLKTIDKLINFGHSPPIPMTVDMVNKLLGTKITFKQFRQLERLGFRVTESFVQSPDFRDVLTIADVAEEVFRQIGSPALELRPLSKRRSPRSEVYRQQLAVKIALSRVGLTETATSSFVENGQVELKNPFSQEEPFLRPNLLTGLLKTLSKNPFLKRAAFFELGQVFEPVEGTKLGVIIAGYKDWTDWQTKISSAVGRRIFLAPVNTDIAQKLYAKQGQLHWAEVPLAGLKPKESLLVDQVDRPLAKFKPISKFPPLTRDVTVLEVDATKLMDKAQKEFSPELLQIEVIDRYLHPSTRETSITLRLLFQKMTGSFTETEIQQLTQRLTDFLK